MLIGSKDIFFMVVPSGEGKIEKNKRILLHRNVDLKNKQKNPKVTSALTWVSRYKRKDSPRCRETSFHILGNNNYVRHFTTYHVISLTRIMNFPTSKIFLAP